jgi:hypothetical protein
VDLASIIAARKAALAGLIARRDGLEIEARSILEQVEAEHRTGLTEEETTRHLDLLQQRGVIAEQITAAEADLVTYERSLAEEQEVQRQQQDQTQRQQTQARGYDQQARVGDEARTYSPGSDPKGVQFALDVARQFSSGDMNARDRLQRHMQEERVERGKKLEQLEQRAAGTGAFSALVVPEYLTDLFAPFARAGRPFADACRHHDLPETGMTAYIGKATTGTTVDDQSAENANVSETDFDDTLISVGLRTAGGSQTLSRQSIERGVGVDDTVVQDLFSAHATNLDGKLLNAATVGLTNVATAIAYTDGTPTGPELYPKLLAAPAAVEAALLNMALGDTIAVMHSRRWYWLQSQMTSTWPLFGQPGTQAQQAGLNYGEKYGSGFRGVLPSGTPVIVDNNIATNYGAGTNEDEIYFGAQSEFHLWEDVNAPYLIRAEQPNAKKLGVDLVVYSYYAFLHNRRAHAQKVNGTGLVTPTF